MNDLILTYAGSDYLDRVRPLVDGTVKPAGIALRYVPYNLGDLFRRVAQHAEFDVAEMSASTYMNLIDRGDDRLMAIPVFPSRYFRHGTIFVNTTSGIREPRDLIGRNVGVPEYQMTAALWQRAVLMHDYGVMPQDLKWFQGGVTKPGYVERNPIASPPGVSIEIIPSEKWLEGMLADGELDALCSPHEPGALYDGTGRLRRLFPNWVEVEQDYYRRTGLFPIMHLVVLRRDVYQANRWIAVSLLNAFTQARRIGWLRLIQTGTLEVMLPWLTRDVEELAAVMGPDHWPYGFQPNYQVLDAMCRFHFEQGLSSRRLHPEDLFAPETHEAPLIYEHALHLAVGLPRDRH